MAGKPAKGPSSSQTAKLAKARAREYTLQGLFKLGYRNKEDVSNLPAYTLVVGSQNVLTNAAEQVGIRQGYVLDGTAGNQNTYGVDSAYDFLTKIGNVQNLRKWGPNLEVRYQNPVTQAVSWVTIYSALQATNVCNFTNFWDQSGEVSMFALFVNGDNNVYEWSGGVASVASVTANSITISGTKTLAQLGFYNTAANTGKFKLFVDGITYTYTGPSTSVPFTQAPTNNKISVTSARQSSQQFTTGAGAFLIQNATININASGISLSSSNFTATINADNAGVPGAILASATASFGSGYGHSPGDFTLSFTFPNSATQVVQPLTVYHLVISSPTGDCTVYTGNMAAVGTNISTDSGATWAPQNGYMAATITELDSSPYTFGGVTPSPFTTSVVDSYSESNSNPSAERFLNGGTEIGDAQSFTGTNRMITKSTFYIRKIGGATGTLVSKLYTDAGVFGTSSIPGTLLATSDPVDPSTLQTTLTLQDFTFSGANQYQMVAGVKYCISIEFTATGGEVGVGANNIPPIANGNGAISNNLITWTAASALDICFYVYGYGTSIATGDAVVQPVVIGNSTTQANVALPTNYTFDLISTLANQVWYGSLTSTIVYVSKTNNYYDTRFSVPQRLPAEGALLNLDSTCTGFSPQGTEMYVSSGQSQWWLSAMFQQTVVVSGVSTPTETLYLQRLKTANGQGAQSQALIARFKNSLAYVSYEPIFNTLGLVQNIQSDPQVVNLSDPIKYDIDAYNFSNGQVFYFNYFLYLSVPSMGVVRMFNVNKKYWEAPQLLPVSRFYLVGNQLYGHDSGTNQSYQLFTGNNDNGNPINAAAAFPYVSQEGGSAPQKKNFNKQYTEGYIAGNTTLTLTVNYDFGGFSGNYSVGISGANKAIIFNKITDGSLGQNTLGTQPIGAILNLPNQPANPKFRVVNTFPRTNCFEYQLIYSSNDIDQDWSLLRFGPDVGAADDIGVEITL